MSWRLPQKNGQRPSKRFQLPPKTRGKTVATTGGDLQSIQPGPPRIHIRYKLHAIGFDMVPVLKPTHLPELTVNRERLEMLSRMEHARWCAERWLDGWAFNTVRNDNLKRHDLLLPWEELDETAQNIDEELVNNIGLILQHANLWVMPLESRPSSYHT